MKSRILHTADFHIGASKKIIVDYFERQNTMCNEILRIATKKEVNFILLCGDIFHLKTVQEVERLIFISFLVGAEHLGIPVFIINGQHDLLEGKGTSLDHIKKLIDGEHFKRHRIALLKPVLWNYRDLKILAVPHVRKREKSVAQILEDHGDVDILMAHECFRGSSTDTGWIADTSAYQPIPEEGYKYLAGGDIHKCQKIGKHGYYSGSPIQNEFGDGERRGVLWFDTETWDPKLCRLQGIKPLVTLDADHDFSDEEIPDAYIRLTKTKGKEITNKTLLERVVKVENKTVEFEPIKVTTSFDVMEGLPEMLGKLGLSNKQQMKAVDIVKKIAKDITA